MQKQVGAPQIFTPEDQSLMANLPAHHQGVPAVMTNHYPKFVHNLPDGAAVYDTGVIVEVDGTQRVQTPADQRSTQLACQHAIQQERQRQAQQAQAQQAQDLRIAQEARDQGEVDRAAVPMSSPAGIPMILGPTPTSTAAPSGWNPDSRVGSAWNRPNLAAHAQHAPSQQPVHQVQPMVQGVEDNDPPVNMNHESTPPSTKARRLMMGDLGASDHPDCQEHQNAKMPAETEVGEWARFQRLKEAIDTTWEDGLRRQHHQDTAPNSFKMNTETGKNCYIFPGYAATHGLKELDSPDHEFQKVHMGKFLRWTIANKKHKNARPCVGDLLWAFSISMWGVFMESIKKVVDNTIGDMLKYKCWAPAYCMVSSSTAWSEKEVDSWKFQQLLGLIKTWLVTCQYDDFAWIRSCKVYLMVRQNKDMPCWASLQSIIGHRTWTNTGIWKEPDRNCPYVQQCESMHWDDIFTCVSRSTAEARDGPEALNLFAVEDQRFSNQCDYESFEKKRIKKAALKAEKKEKVSKMQAEKIEIMEKLDALNAQLQAEAQESDGTA